MLSHMVFRRPDAHAVGFDHHLHGVHFVFNPETTTAMAHLNPSLWWGMVMLFSGLLFLIPSWQNHRSGK